MMEGIEKAWKILESDAEIVGLPIGIRRDVLACILDLNERVKKLEQR